MRLLPLATALTLAVAMGVAPAQENRLPDIGSSAGELLTPARQAEYGKIMLAELRNYDYVLDDPLVTDWLQTMGTRLGANSDQPQQPFTFFMLRDRQINAFATLGGYIAVNAGLVLTAEREDEVAAVLSHEIAHVTQQHVLRGVERAQRDQIPILLGMLAAVVAAQQAGGNSSGDATMATITSAMGLMQQRQIDYTRSNESEADRLGIRTLVRSGYDVDAMAGFFERMSVAMRANEGGYSAPDFADPPGDHHPHQRGESARGADEEKHRGADHLGAGRHAPGARGPVRPVVVRTAEPQRQRVAAVCVAPAGGCAEPQQRPAGLRLGQGAPARAQRQHAR